jgi:hypothetical protein
VREVLLIEQVSARPELWRWDGTTYRRVHESVRSEVTGLEFACGATGLAVTHVATGRCWLV